MREDVSDRESALLLITLCVVNRPPPDPLVNVHKCFQTTGKKKERVQL